MLIVSESDASEPFAVAVGFLMGKLSIPCFEAYVSVRRMWVAARVSPMVKSALLMFEQQLKNKQCRVTTPGDRGQI